MSTQPRFNKEEYARRGEKTYWSKVHAFVRDLPPRTVVALDIETGEFAVGDDVRTAFEALQARKPDAQAWCVRVGHRPVPRRKS
jgi:hypothetical protein